MDGWRERGKEGGGKAREGVREGEREREEEVRGRGKERVREREGGE